MKIYTKTGDAGETSLYGGQRVSKDDLRMQTCGSLDECNAVLGCALASIEDQQIRAVLIRIQGELFEVGADIATPEKLGAIVPRVREELTLQLEEEIDTFETELTPLRNFILPGGGTGGAMLHVARGVCRRAERHLTSLQQHETINPEALRYINRLSDHLFVLARLANERAGVPETIWERPG